MIRQTKNDFILRVNERNLIIILCLLYALTEKLSDTNVISDKTKINDKSMKDISNARLEFEDFTDLLHIIELETRSEESAKSSYPSLAKLLGITPE